MNEQNEADQYIITKPLAEWNNMQRELEALRKRNALLEAFVKKALYLDGIGPIMSYDTLWELGREANNLVGF